MPAIRKMYVGSSEVVRIYRGSTLIFQGAAPTFTSVTIGALNSGSVPVSVVGLNEAAPNSYYGLYTASQPSLTTTQIMAGNDQSGASATASGTFSAPVDGSTVISITGAPDGDDLYLYLAFGDAGSNVSDPVFAGIITTPASGWSAPSVTAGDGQITISSGGGAPAAPSAPSVTAGDGQVTLTSG